jgi:zinc transport system substrate-binding protein
VVTTIYPLEYFASVIGGDHAEVRNIVPAGSEPHDYEPTPRQVAEVLEADVLVTIGAGLDAWAAEAGSDALTVTATEVVETTNEDPHVWLDPVLAQHIAFALRDAFTATDPEHARDYNANTEGLVAALQSLHDEYERAFVDCELNDIIVSHDAFGYLARRYEFTLHPIAGLSPEAEPSVRDLSNLAKQARNLGVTTIFFETLVSPDLAHTLASEIGAETAVLNPLEGLSGEEISNGEDYFSVMEANLQALQSAMLCQ